MPKQKERREKVREKRGPLDKALMIILKPPRKPGDNHRAD